MLCTRSHLARTSMLTVIGSMRRVYAGSADPARIVNRGERMVSSTPVSTPRWSWVWPLLALIILGIALATGVSGVIAAGAEIVLIATVFAAVYHAEVVAHRIGEPLGTLVLAVAVTIIEVALIVSVMIAHPAEKA